MWKVGNEVAVYVIITYNFDIKYIYIYMLNEKSWIVSGR